VPRVNAFCPNVVATDLLMQFRRVPEADWPDRLSEVDPPETAARIALALTTAPYTGRYLEEGVVVAPSPQACDPKLAERLWRRCSALTGLPEN